MPDLFKRARWTAFHLVLSLCVPVFLPGASSVRAETAAPPAFLEERDIKSFVYENFRQSNFKALDDYAVELRARIAAMTADEYGVSAFYNALGIYSIGGEGEKTIADWRAAAPNSATPVLAVLAGRTFRAAESMSDGLMTPRPWSPSGSELSDLAGIRQALFAAKPLAHSDPYYYYLEAKLCIALSCRRDEMFALLNEGLDEHPKYSELAVFGTNYYLSKWSGDAEGLENWATQMSGRFATNGGAAMYAKVYWQALNAQYGGQLFELTLVKWDRLMAGIRELIDRQPTDDHLNQAAAMACLGGNRALTRQILTNPNFKYSDFQWYQIGGKVRVYPICRKWAAEVPSATADPSSDQVPKTPQPMPTSQSPPR